MFAGQVQTLGNVLGSRQNFRKDSRPSHQINLERTWVQGLPPDAHVIFPDSTPPSAKHASVLVCTKHNHLLNTWSWRCLDWQTGRIRWEENASRPIQIARWTPVLLLIGTSAGWQAREAEQGRRVWTNENPLAPSTPLFAIQSSEFGDECAWPTLFDAERGFQLIDPNDGRPVSRIKPPGRIHEHFAIGSPRGLKILEQATTKTVNSEDLRRGRTPGRDSNDDSLVAFIQTVKPTRTWLATTSSPRNPWSVQEISTGGEPWSQPPFGGANRIIGLTREYHLVGLEIDEGSRRRRSSEANVPDGVEPSEIVEFLRHPTPKNASSRFDEFPQGMIRRHPELNGGLHGRKLDRSAKSWEYRNFAIGQTTPFAWERRDQVLVVSDGSLLMSFNPANGKRKWSIGLADFPIESPAQQICVLGDTVFATSQGWLRGLDCKDGTSRIERFLGDAAPQWKTTVAWKSHETAAFISQPTTKDSLAPPCGLLAIWPRKTTTAAGSAILLCDAVTGEVTQRLHFDSEPKNIVIDSDGNGLVWTEKSLTGLQPLRY